MTINLPGDWRVLEMTTETPNDPSCTGPLCGSPDINAVLESKPGSTPIIGCIYPAGSYRRNTSIAIAIR